MAPAAPEGSLRVRQEASGATRTRVGPSAIIGAHDSLLRTHRNRPCCCRTAEKRDELAPASLDHLVGAQYEPRRNVMANGLCGLEIDDELDVARLLDRQIGRFCAAK
jgi:hypothetical protein